jgi:beta-mannosidase
MKSGSILLILLINIIPVQTNSQNMSIELNKNWQFKNQKERKWYKATVPGTVHTDLLANKLIPDPYYRDNENRLQWVDKADWEYRTIFNVDEKTFASKRARINFKGLDTYATVYLNGHLILQADNMFREWIIPVEDYLKRSNNILLIRFASAQRKADSIAKSRLPLILPDNNRVYVRKAQYHFGWDWGPKFAGCGIWKTVTLFVPVRSATKRSRPIKPFANLIQQKDSIGTSFYFEKEGKPIYAKGANWIPADVFLPRVKKADYRRMLQTAKDANMNMLRVWGGGVYEADEFYDFCDSLGIMVWQDFMFAGGMYPGDDAFLDNVREEVKYQIQRLRHHPCIVLWCGNNEVEEAWKNWGWQNQYNLHGADSVKVWSDYKRLFEDSLKKWVEDLDGTRPYVSTSPKNGWGHKESFTEGDSHYWGVWWGLEDWETFENKTGRFTSEYGMQAMPNWNTIKKYTASSDRYLYSPVIQSHQKASDGFKKLNHYLTRYFIDSAKLNRLSLEDYTYLAQCMQYYILKNCIAVHRSKYPANMGTLLWQLNDCWPVTSWSITDYSRQSKAAWYAVKEAYRDDVLPVRDPFYPKNLKLEKPEFTLTVTQNVVYIRSNSDARYVYLSSYKKELSFSDNYFDLKANETKKIQVQQKNFSISDFKIRSLYDILNAD